MSSIEHTFREIKDAIAGSLTGQPDTIESRMALISALLMFASGMAEQCPKEVRQHWAKEFYKHVDKLAE